VTARLLDLPDLIEWHEGMLLAPQHFQQFAARSELLTQFMFTQGAAFRWGLIDLKIDSAALSGGILRVLNVEALMPDGMLALGGSERGVKLEFDLRKAESNPVRVCIAVPNEPALYNRSDYSRYEAYVGKDELTSDEVSGSDPATIPRIRPRLRLDAGRSNLGGMTALPLIEFDAQGTVLRQTEYLAPMLAVEIGSPLATIGARVDKAVREMATDLAAKLSPNARKTDPAGIQQLQWLVSGLPLFEALLESGGAHPYDLYRALCSMAGSVAFLSNARVPPIFSPYKHDDLRTSFQEVIGFIQLALSEGLIESWVDKDFSLAQEAVEKAAEAGSRSSEPTYEIGPTLEQAFAGEADFAAPYLGLVLRLPRGVTPDSMTAWGESCLLAPEDAMSDLEVSRSRGAICERVDFLEDLVVAPGSVLFRVLNDPKWIDPRKKLVLRPAKQETRVPEAVTLFVKKRNETSKGV
jgi:type VI secretion system protein ImpJ